MHQSIDEQNKSSRLRQLGTLSHVAQRDNCHNTYHQLRKKEDIRSRNGNADNTYGNDMQEDSCARIVKHTRDNRTPYKWHKVDKFLVVYIHQNQESSRDDNRHQDSEEQYMTEIIQ